MSLKIGDKVKFRKGLVNGELYGNLTYRESMEYEPTKVFTIVEVSKVNNGVHYKLDSDWWVNDLMIRVVPVKKFNLKDYPGVNAMMVVHTGEQLDRFLRYLRKHDRRWDSGDAYMSTDDERFRIWVYREISNGEQVAINFNQGLWGVLDSVVNLSEIEVLDFDDFDWDSEAV